MTATATTVHAVHAEACPEIGPICQKRAEPPQQHDQRFWVGELRVGLERGLTQAWALEAQLPVRVTASRITYRHSDGTAFTPDYPNIHHHNETVVGLGDAWLLGRYAFGGATVHGALRFGATLPLGGTVPDPFALGEQGKEHEHIQLGTGVVQPIIGIAAVAPVGRWQVRAHAMAILGVYANVHGYQPGHRTTAGLGLATDIGAVRVSLGADVAHEFAESWAGMHHNEGNLSRTDVLVAAGVSWAVGQTWRSTVTLQVPVVQHVVDDAMTYPAILQWRWDGAVGK